MRFINHNFTQGNLKNLMQNAVLTWVQNFSAYQQKNFKHMKFTLVFILSIIFLLLSFLHIYWVLGGRWGLETSVPDQLKEVFFKEEQQQQFRLATLFVAIGLALFALLTFANSHSFDLSPNWIKIATRLMASIFFIRAIGDFNIVGVFKRQKESVFARNDTLLYVPLCFFIAGLGFLITYL